MTDLLRAIGNSTQSSPAASVVRQNVAESDVSAAFWQAFFGSGDPAASSQEKSILSSVHEDAQIPSRTDPASIEVGEPEPKPTRVAQDVTIEPSAPPPIPPQTDAEGGQDPDLIQAAPPKDVGGRAPLGNYASPPIGQTPLSDASAEQPSPPRGGMPTPLQEAQPELPRPDTPPRPATIENRQVPVTPDSPSFQAPVLSEPRGAREPEMFGASQAEGLPKDASQFTAAKPIPLASDASSPPVKAMGRNLAPNAVLAQPTKSVHTSILAVPTGQTPKGGLVATDQHSSSEATAPSDPDKAASSTVIKDVTQTQIVATSTRLAPLDDAAVPTAVRSSETATPHPKEAAQQGSDGRSTATDVAGPNAAAKQTTPMVPPKSVEGSNPLDAVGEMTSADIQLPPLVTGQTGAPAQSQLSLPSPAPSPAQAQALWSQLQPQLPQPNQTVEIALHPKELGPLKLLAQSAEGGLTLTILAERPETLDLMRRHLDQLHDDLRRAGFNTVSFGQENNQQTAMHHQEKPAQEDEGRHGRKEGNQPAEGGLTVTTTAPPEKVGSEGQLDMRV